MTIIKISEMDAAAALDGTELLPAVQGGDSVRTTVQDIVDLVPVSSGDLFRRLYKNLYWDGQAEGLVQHGGPVFTPSGIGAATTVRAAPADAQLLDTYDHVKRASGNPVAQCGYIFATNSEEYFPGRISGHAKGGGFALEMHWGYRTAEAGGYIFAGLVDGTTTMTTVGTEPSSYANIIGVSKDAADVNLKFISNDGTGSATKTDTGISVATAKDKYLILTITYVPGTVAYVVTLRVADTPTDATTTFTTNLPVADIMFKACVLSAPESAASDVTFMKLIIFTPDLTA